MRALFVGRFQPFHNGHLKVIKKISEKYSDITVVIAGPAKRDVRDPFTFQEREKMVRKVLKFKGTNFRVFKVHNVNDNKKWCKKINRLGKFDVAFSRNPLTIKCLKMAGIKIRKHEFYERYKNCGREIRKRILRGKKWESLVPKEVYEYLKSINGEERIKSIS